MKKIVLYYIEFNVLFVLVQSSTSCSIFPSLNCSCFQSNYDLNSPLPIKTYSHLYCQGNSLNKKTFEYPFGSDFLNQNRFRTISIEFYLKNNIEIHPNQFNSLSNLFSQTDANALIEISIRFNGFNHITLNKHSFTSNLFPKKHQNKHLWLRFIPTTLNSIQNESGENPSNQLDDQFKFSENCFSDLIVSQLNLYIYSKHDRFSSLYPFEYIFNNTNIGELHFHGSIFPPGSSLLRRTFKGLIRSLTLHRHVDIIDSNTYPYYYPVYSYNIHSIEAHSMNLNSFIPEYTNLRGLKLIKPRFEVKIDRLIPSLDSLTLDIEYLNEETLLSARHIHYLKLGSSLRRINSQVLNSLLNRLLTFDLSDINLSEMTRDSRCSLINYIINNYQKKLNIILPNIEFLTECDCAKLILNDIQLKTKKDYFNNDSFCTKQCHFSDCPVISQYFRDKYPHSINNQRKLPISHNDDDDDLPSIDVFSDRNDVDMMTFLLNQTNNLNRKQSSRIPIELDDINDDNYFLSSSGKDQLNKSKKKSFFSWLTFLIGGIIILTLTLLIIGIRFCIIRYRKEKHFKSVPVYV